MMMTCNLAELRQGNMDIGVDVFVRLYLAGVTDERSRAFLLKIIEDCSLVGYFSDWGDDGGDELLKDRAKVWAAKGFVVRHMIYADASEGGDGDWDHIWGFKFEGGLETPVAIAGTAINNDEDRADLLELVQEIAWEVAGEEGPIFRCRDCGRNFHWLDVHQDKAMMWRWTYIDDPYCGCKDAEAVRKDRLGLSRKTKH